MTIAVLALQGAFIEHEKRLQSLGAQVIELRCREDLKKQYDGIVLPGGESTVQGKLLRELGMLDILREQIEDGIAVLATCAGLILLADQVENDDRAYFRTLPVRVKRNAYGRQLASFHTRQELKGIGQIPMTFIRAPYIDQVEPGVEILSVVDGNIVAVRYKKQLALSFHPELDADWRIHECFLSML